MHRAEASALINGRLGNAEYYYEVSGGISFTMDTPR